VKAKHKNLLQDAQDRQKRKCHKNTNPAHSETIASMDQQQQQ
jgi:hypothetical protein